MDNQTKRHLESANQRAIALRKAGQVAESTRIYEDLCRRFPTIPQLHNNLATNHQLLGRKDLAEGCYRQAIALSTGYDSPWLGLGRLLADSGRLAEAVDHYQAALVQFPGDTRFHLNLGLVLNRMKRGQEAIPHLARAAEAGNEQAAHILATIQGRATPRAPKSYVRELFDGYAPRFESHLVEGLQYRTPWLLAERIKALLPDASLGDMLDLGCGTGLGAQALAGLYTQATGVDLSPKMLAEAAKKGLYARLIEGDLLDTLGDWPAASVDTVIAADVFVYLGDLAPIFAAVQRVLRPGGLFCFTVEQAEAGEPAPYCLRGTSRYAHHADYIQTLAETGFQPLAVESGFLRRDTDGDIVGILGVVRRR